MFKAESGYRNKMKRKRNLITPLEKYFYIYELITIFLYFALSITQEVLVLKAYVVYEASSTQYYRFILNERLTIPNYPSNVTLVDASMSCPDDFTPVNLLTVQSFARANFIDITANTTIKNPHRPGEFFNNSQMMYNFYQFDIHPLNLYLY